jgi:sugar phosphate isomerase/epimerase
MNNDSFISSLAAGVALIERVGRDNFGLMLDLWHVWHETMIEERVAALKGLIMGVHISDWPHEQPRATGDRLIPGQGCINLPGLFAALERSGYQGAYCLEIFSADHLPDSLWQGDPRDLIRNSKQGFVQAWEGRHATG